jgi:hypothetical protein
MWEHTVSGTIYPILSSPKCGIYIIVFGKMLTSGENLALKYKSPPSRQGFCPARNQRQGSLPGFQNKSCTLATGCIF